jgi:virulence-associated protein VagC
MTVAIKKKWLFKHGGSYAVDVPIEFAHNLSRRKKVVVEYDDNTLIIHPENELDTIESEPQFMHFIRAIAQDAIAHPEKLRTGKEVWDTEWDELLKDVEIGK